MTDRRSKPPPPGAKNERPSFAPERFPTGAMSVPPPPPEDEDVEPAEPRKGLATGFVPPRLGLASPRGQRFSDPNSAIVGQWLNSIVRSLRGMHMYAGNNVRRKEFLDQSVKLLSDVHRVTEHVELTILPDRILSGRDLVHLNPDLVEGLPQLFYANGVRRVRLSRGATPLEIFRFLGALVTDFTQRENKNDDLVSIFSRLGLGHVAVFGAEPAAAPPRPPAPLQKPAAKPAAPTAPRDASGVLVVEFEDDEPLRLATKNFKALVEDDEPLRLATANFKAIVDEPAPLPIVEKVSFTQFAEGLSAPAGLPERSERKHENTDVTEAATMRWARPDDTLDEGVATSPGHTGIEIVTKTRPKSAKARGRSRVSGVKRKPTR